MATQGEGGGASAQVTVYAVGITYRDGGDGGAFRGLAPSAVTHGVSGAQLLDLQDLNLQRGHGGQVHIRQGADAVDADAQAHHVVLVLREALYAGAVEDVPHRPVAYAVYDFLRALLEALQLIQGEGVLVRFVGHAEVGEQSFHAHLGALVQVFYEFRELAFHKAQAVHAGVQLDVDGVILHSFFPQHSY